MNLSVKPASCLSGKIIPPASKSYSIRAFIIAALGGNSKIINPSLSDDVRIAMDACKSLGAKIKKIKNNSWQVKGVGSQIRFPKVLKVKESGTTLRFLLSLAALSPRKMIIRAEGTLNSRPNHPLISVLRKKGADIKGCGVNEATPITINKGRLRAGRISIDGTLSSQFISSLLITAPLLKGNSLIKVAGNYVVSSPYIDMTLAVLRRAGIKVTKKSQRLYRVEGDQRFKGLNTFKVPADYGLSAFLMAAACLTNSKIILKIEKDNLVQADKKIIDFLKKMGISIRVFKNKIEIKGSDHLKGGDFSCRDCPDLVPVLGILALFADKKTRLYAIGHLRAKESDRISDFRSELLKVGAKVKETRDELIIYPTSKLKTNCLIDPHNDHRLAMAFAVLGLKTGIKIKNIECVNKSY
ncbi:MAG: 3-phosphoshikimate 1-carboxyvinyltransferase, partial [Candidatus Omnitrophica bacterium]|nr:3-phosphoshikimate 1-carboxyvinyltransferase [Candidatus Omnitrophota bacterium]